MSGTWPAKVTAPIIRKTDTSGNSRQASLEILVPPNRAEYIVTGEHSGDRIRLKTSLDSQSVLHWYLDDKYLGKSKPDNSLHIKLQPGTHTLTCLALDNNSERIDKVNYKVTK